MYRTKDSCKDSWPSELLVEALDIARRHPTLPLDRGDVDSEWEMYGDDIPRTTHHGYPQSQRYGHHGYSQPQHTRLLEHPRLTLQLLPSTATIEEYWPTLSTIRTTRLWSTKNCGGDMYVTAIITMRPCQNLLWGSAIGVDTVRIRVG